MSIRAKLLIVILIITAVPLAILGYISYRISANALERAVQSQLSKSLEDVEKTVSLYLRDQGTKLDKFSKNDDFLLWIANKDSGKNVDFLYEIFSATFKYRMEKDAAILGIKAYDSSGKPLFSFFKKGVMKKSYFKNGIYFSKKYIIFTKKTGDYYVSLYEKAEPLQKLVSGIKLSGSSTFFAFIYSEPDKTIFEPGSVLTGATAALNQHSRNTGSFILRQENEAYRINMKKFREFYVGIAESLVGTAISVKEYSKPITKIKQTGYLIIALTLIAAFLIAFFISSVISKPILEVAQMSKTIASGNYDLPLTINRKDEVGILASSFENMREKVKSTINDLDRQLKQLSSLYDLGNSINSRNDINEIISLVIETLNIGFDVDKAAILLYEEDDDIYSIAGSAGLNTDTIMNMRIEAAEMKQFVPNSAYKALNTAAAPQLFEYISDEDKANLKQIVVFPLIGGGTTHGYLLLFEHTLALSKQDIQFVSILTSLIAPTLYTSDLNKKLQEFSSNAFAILQQRIDTALAEAKKFNMPVSIARLEFKNHALIKNYASIKTDIYSFLTETDRIYRSGFNELILLLDGREKAEAKRIIEDLIENKKLEVDYFLCQFPINVKDTLSVLKKLKVL